MISWCDECALKQNRAQFRRLFLQCCHGAGVTIATPFSRGNCQFYLHLVWKTEPQCSQYQWLGNATLLAESKQRGQMVLFWLPCATLSPSEDLPSIISGFQCWHTGDWQAVQCPILWLVATGRKERHYLKEWLATLFLWTGRTVPSVSGQRVKSSSKL